MRTRVLYMRTDRLGVLLRTPEKWEFLWDWRQEKIFECRQEEDKLRALGAGLLLYHGLTGCCGISPEQVSFSFGKNGKPALLLRGEPTRDVFFNISHSGCYAAAVFSEHPAGIDVEVPRAGAKRVAERFFSEREQAYLRDAQWDAEEFTRLWTRKESYIKATGEGISCPLGSFCTLEERVGDYFFKTYGLPGQAYLSVCTEHEAVTAELEEYVEKSR